MTISKDDTIILDGAGDKKGIEERCEQVCLWLLSDLFSNLPMLGYLCKDL